MNCPLCNGKPVQSEVDNDLLVCTGCRELLCTHELVGRATILSRWRYTRRNRATSARP